MFRTSDKAVAVRPQGEKEAAVTRYAARVTGSERLWIDRTATDGNSSRPSCHACGTTSAPVARREAGDEITGMAMVLGAPDRIGLVGSHARSW
jgi:hypothetical protein